MAYIWRNLIIGKQILPKICNNLTKFKYENDILNSFSDIFSLKIVYCFQKCSHIHFDHILLLPPTPPMFSSSQPLLLTHQILCSFPLFSRFRALCRREGAKITRASADRWLQDNSVFQAPKAWCMYELTETGTAFIILYKLTLDKASPIT